MSSANSDSDSGSAAMHPVSISVVKDVYEPTGLLFVSDPTFSQSLFVCTTICATQRLQLASRSCCCVELLRLRTSSFSLDQQSTLAVVASQLMQVYGVWNGDWKNSLPHTSTTNSEHTAVFTLSDLKQFETRILAVRINHLSIALAFRENIMGAMETFLLSNGKKLPDYVIRMEPIACDSFCQSKHVVSDLQSTANLEATRLCSELAVLLMAFCQSHCDELTRQRAPPAKIPIIRVDLSHDIVRGFGLDRTFSMLDRQHRYLEAAGYARLIRYAGPVVGSCSNLSGGVTLAFTRTGIMPYALVFPGDIPFATFFFPDTKPTALTVSSEVDNYDEAEEEELQKALATNEDECHEVREQEDEKNQEKQEAPTKEGVKEKAEDNAEVKVKGEEDENEDEDDEGDCKPVVDDPTDSDYKEEDADADADAEDGGANVDAVSSSNATSFGRVTKVLYDQVQFIVTPSLAHRYPSESATTGRLVRIVKSPDGVMRVRASDLSQLIEKTKVSHMITHFATPAEKLLIRMTSTCSNDRGTLCNFLSFAGVVRLLQVRKMQKHPKIVQWILNTVLPDLASPLDSLLSASAAAAV